MGALISGAGCGGGAEPSASHATTELFSKPFDLDPCIAISKADLSKLNLEVSAPNEFRDVFNEYNLKFKGCLMAYGPGRSEKFHLESVNFTLQYFKSWVEGVQQQEMRELEVAGRAAVLESDSKYPGQCILAVEMTDYRLLLDGVYSSGSCDYPVKLAGELVPLLAAK
ncbi:DUF3558 domain-containing protein [Nocardia macrotermitis]|nr:hypothetical protein [Nocardia macrotermitis]